MNTKIVMQECNGCGARFRTLYKDDGTYEYLDEPCACEDGFSPAEGEPSISQWMDTLSGLKKISKPI